MKPFRGLLTEKENALVYITGIAYDLGASVGKGASFAPSVIRDLSKHLPPFTMDGDSIEDIKLYDNDIITPDSLDDIKNKTLELFTENIFNVFIGGDHSVSIPLEENFYDYWIKQNKTPVIIHIDAHPDFCDFYDGSKYSHACPNMRAYDKGYKLENITLIGIRGFERQEVEFFDKHPELKIYRSSYIKENGINNMLEQIINKYSSEEYVVYISYDIDANDPSFVSGTGTPEAFGMDSYEVLKVITTLINKLNVKCFDIVEVSPTLDDKNNTASWLVLKTLYEVFRKLIEKR
ncbi:MAG: arginase family protein [Bacilli bacterium]|nr:arginase family protein [Bacilli bacterium]